MISTEIQGIKLKFMTEPSNFSPKNIDSGTLAMLSYVQFSDGDKILDLGCGYGVVGIYAAKIIGGQNVVMLDSNDSAVEMSRKNAELNSVSDVKIIRSDGFRSLDEAGFTMILSNPPYHTDFSVAKHFIEKGFNRLVIGGKMVMVTKRRDWYKNKFRAIFGGVIIKEINGYYIFIGEKRSGCYKIKALN